MLLWHLLRKSILHFRSALRLKNDTDVAHYNFDTLQLIMIFLGYLVWDQQFGLRPNYYAKCEVMLNFGLRPNC